MQASKSMADALIVGAGPAGVSCALWLARLGFAPLLLDAADQVGGLCLSNPYVAPWNASLPGATGRQVAANLAASLVDAGVASRLSFSVRDAQRCADGFAVLGTDGARLYGRFLVLACGVRARGLSAIPLPDGPVGEVRRLLVGPGAHVATQDFQGKRVAVLGGGDNAFENALYAQERGARVTLFARTIRAQRQFRRDFPEACVVLGEPQVDAVAHTVNGAPFDLILVLYGWEPRVDFAQGLALARTPAGFLHTDFATAATSCPGVYAIGEVAQRQHPCIVTAMADGIVAAKAIQARLEAEE